MSRPVFQEAVDLVATVAEVTVWPEETPPPYDRLRAEAREADGLFCLLTDRIDKPLLDDAPRLRVVSNMAVGYDNVDVDAASRRGIYVGNTPGVLTETTAEFAFALMLAFARRVPQGDRMVRDGRWKTWGPMTLLGSDLRHATLGIVGLGRIGQIVAAMARGFEMRVVYCSRTRKPDVETRLGIEYVPTLEALLAQADYVSLHVPLNPETRRLIGEAQFGAMRPNAVLINTARGEVVDQQALVAALESGRLGGAALDVADPEPMAPNDPLLKLDNVLVTPHIASASRATRLKMATMAAQNIVDVLEGRRPTHCVNPEAGGGR